ncbi:hypothetical protein CTAM01_09594 [Colletotrichum tamarilloi]|uniref:Uncharacterized protein n=1 Tax=Colletotrichum tamarilloi TaxID=1209934 RepID=A0ABQ9R2T3_9PEZI|nr:uncharacterized protein CTAM01_09594 [Colletotrichum tamarilloi]KAK1492967.1 hypothetical protein CTAM01_09594 [Colletotrichum tamarilloi]
MCGDGDNVCVKERNKRPEVIAEPTVSIRLLSKARVPAIAKGNLGVEKAHLAGPNRARTPGGAHAVPIFPVIRKCVQRRSWLYVAARSLGGNGLTAFRGPFIGHGMWLDHTVVDTGIPKAASGGRFSACLCSECRRFKSNGWKQARSGNSQMLGEDSAKRLSKPFEPRGGQTRRSNGGDVTEGPLMPSKLQVDWPMRETRK